MGEDIVVQGDCVAVLDAEPEQRPGVEPELVGRDVEHLPHMVDAAGRGTAAAGRVTVGAATVGAATVAAAAPVRPAGLLPTEHLACSE